MGLSYADAERCGIAHLHPEHPGNRRDEPAPAAAPADVPKAKPAHKPGIMNKTEARFARLLDDLVADGTILRWDFEPVKLRLADKTTYTPDFRLILPDMNTVLCEIKGKFIREDAMIKLRVAAELHPYPFFLAIWDGRRWAITRLPSRATAGVATGLFGDEAHEGSPGDGRE